MPLPPDITRSCAPIHSNRKYTHEMILLPEYSCGSIYVAEERFSYTGKLYIPFFYPVKNVHAPIKYGTSCRVVEFSARIATRWTKPAWAAEGCCVSRRRSLKGVRRGVLSLPSLTDANCIHYHSFCLTCLSRFAGFLVDAPRIVKSTDRMRLQTYFQTGF